MSLRHISRFVDLAGKAGKEPLKFEWRSRIYFINMLDVEQLAEIQVMDNLLYSLDRYFFFDITEYRHT